MSASESTLLREQLAELLARPDSPEDGGPVDPLRLFELAVVAGLLARIDAEAEGLEAARQRAGALTDEVLLAALLDALEHLEDVDLDASGDESWSPLCGLDEACAAACFAGRGRLTGPVVHEALGLMEAFPEPWRAHAPLASTVLVSRPPLPGDAAVALWATVEASPGITVTPEGSDRLPPQLRIDAGLDVVIQLFGQPPAAAASTGAVSLGLHERLAADAALPAESPWLPLARHEDEQLALTTDLDNTPIVLIAGWPRGRTAPEGTRDGQAVAWTMGPEGLSTPASAGSWELSIWGRTVRFVLQ